MADSIIPIPINPRFIDLTGQQFSAWKVLSYAGKKGTNPYWNCECKCGTRRQVAGGTLRSGKSISCGCVGYAIRADKHSTHGMTGTPIYQVWQGMIARCIHKSHVSYFMYGGRGISVCDRWRFSFDNFISDMGDRPTKDHSIDRIDPNGDYTPSNCRWATASEQHHNKRPRITNKTGIPGVFFRDGKWHVTIGAHYKRTYLGIFADFFEACCKRKSAETRFWFH